MISITGMRQSTVLRGSEMNSPTTFSIIKVTVLSAL